jgi:hypothetical protein
MDDKWFEKAMLEATNQYVERVQGPITEHVLAKTAYYHMRFLSEMRSVIKLTPAKNVALHVEFDVIRVPVPVKPPDKAFDPGESYSARTHTHVEEQVRIRHSSAGKEYRSIRDLIYAITRAEACWYSWDPGSTPRTCWDFRSSRLPSMTMTEMGTPLPKPKFRMPKPKFRTDEDFRDRVAYYDEVVDVMPVSVRDAVRQALGYEDEPKGGS